eukprot:scaffold285769_cov47-Prasinocladus_malaysianus.AAC.1
MSVPADSRGYDAMLTAVGTLIHRQGRPVGLQPHQVAPQSTREFLRVGQPMRFQQYRASIPATGIHSRWRRRGLG